jgi:acylphosphatase
MTRERRRVHFSGRVQGVGFRATTSRIAASYDVAGYVRNLRDGGVELVVEGEPGVVLAFLDAVRRELGRWIRSESSSAEPMTEPLCSDFSICD